MENHGARRPEGEGRTLLRARNHRLHEVGMPCRAVNLGGWDALEKQELAKLEAPGRMAHGITVRCVRALLALVLIHAFSHSQLQDHDISVDR